MNTSVVIVGAGPAGLACAYTLGKANIATVLVERKSLTEIGDKVCGDALNPYFFKIFKQLAEIPAPDQSSISEQLDQIIINLENVKLQLPGKSATINRQMYGQQLIKQLSSYPSVQLLPDTRFKSLIIDDDKIRGISTNKGEIRANVVIDASGVTAVVRKSLPTNTDVERNIADSDMLISYREIIKTVKPHAYQNKMILFFDSDLNDVMPAYFWIFSKGEYTLNLGLGYYKDHQIKNIRKRTHQIRDKYISNYEVLDGRGAHIPARLPLYTLVSDHFMALGDAGCMVNPINGEGHAPAIFSGIYAAQSIINCNEFSKTELWSYNEKIWKEFGMLHSIGIILNAYIRKHGIDDLKYILKHKIIEGKDLVFTLEQSSLAFDKLFFKLLKLARKPKIVFRLQKSYKNSKRLHQLIQSYPDPTNFNSWKNEITAALERIK
ncbi:MAG: NAD(P)/FAD-dependent oxidoreductase [Candidatus Heimdallarchaeota archaeon]|nr:NAD(P)/FAD-dependent oxidoreductase [Candidatus Heimdallarchaeota archaeon]